jgi:hypothetical protein
VSRGTWRLRAPILGVFALLVLAGCADSTPQVPAAPPPSPTIPAAQVKIFAPASTTVSRTVHGSCWTSSITVAASSAYRCYAGNTILDPCFAAAPAAREVSCYADPWASAVRVLLSAALPKPAPLAVTHPWALELANGKRCVAATGVVTRLGNVALLYRCEHGGSASAPTTQHGHTQVQYVPPGSRAPVAVPVTVTWQALRH